MVQGLYAGLFVLSLVMLFMLTAFFKKQISVYYSLLFAAITVSNLGYMQLVNAETLESAVYATQVVYLGASFLPFLAFACVSDLCQVRQRMWLNIPCITVGAAIFCGVISVGSSDIYYRDIRLVRTESYSFLEKTYGPLHRIYPVYLILLTSLAVWVVIRSFRKRKQISYVVSIVLAFIMSAEVLTYILERVLDIKLELLPFAFVLCQAGTLFLLDRIRLYDVSAISGKSMTESYDYGFVICSASKRLAGTDAAARKWFPELSDIYIDSRIQTDENSTDFMRQLTEWTEGRDSRETVYFERDGRIIEAKYHFLSNMYRKKLHYISLRDDTHQQKYARLIESFNTDLENSVNEKTEKLRQVLDDIILSMASIVENRDNNTGGHIRRTSDIVRIFVDHLLERGCFRELDGRTAESIVKAAPLHDFGKIAIPDVVLNKPGKFTDDEYEIMKKHSEKGAAIVAGILQNSENIMFRNIAVNVANYHHEKWNGKGYPSGLREKGIPFEARVMALADVFDALVSSRVYKESMSFDRAFEIISDSGGTHFDPALCYEFLQCRPELEKLYASYGD